MQETKNTETMVYKNYKPVTNEVIRFVEALDQSRQEKFLMFIRGARFAWSFEDRKTGNVVNH